MKYLITLLLSIGLIQAQDSATRKQNWNINLDTLSAIIQSGLIYRTSGTDWQALTVGDGLVKSGTTFSVDSTVVRTGFSGTGPLDLSGYDITFPTGLTIQFRQGTEAELSGVTLALGEAGFATDSQRFLIGDGVTPGGIVPNIRGRSYDFSGTTTTATPLIISGTLMAISPGTSKLFATRTIGQVSSGTSISIVASYFQHGVIMNNGGTTSLVTSTISDEWETDAALDCTSSANNSNSCLSITVTGKAATTVVWRSTVDIY